MGLKKHKHLKDCARCESIFKTWHKYQSYCFDCRLDTNRLNAELRKRGMIQW